MGRWKIGLERSSAGALGGVLVVDGEVRRRVSGIGSLRRDECCEGGDG